MTRDTAIEAYRSQGYCILRDILLAEEIDALRGAIAETIERVARALRTPFPTSKPDEELEFRFDRIAAEDLAYASALYHAVMADTQRDPSAFALTSHPRLTPLVKDLLAPLVRTGEVIRPRAAIPAYQSKRSPWHQDVTMPRDPRDDLGSVRLACWMPLSDVQPDDGALEVVPGVWDGPLHHETDANGHVFIPDERFGRTERKALSLRRGDVLVLDRFTPHRALPVNRGKARWAFVMWVKAKHVA